jgi:methionyl-tRNA synthetase
MADWYCFEDKVKLEEASVTLTYIVMNRSFSGWRCPKCGVQYLPEEVVMNDVASAEEELDSK